MILWQLDFYHIKKCWQIALLFNNPKNVFILFDELLADG